jgi:hypothetical protein
MRFTASEKFNSIARGAAKIVQRRCYVRKVTDITEAVGSGTAWTEVTSRILEWPGASERIEIGLGQQTSDSANVVAHGVQWWRDTVFNATALQEIEFKTETHIGLSDANLATETMYEFCGFIDKVNVESDELTDEVRFTAYTLDDRASRIAGENITTQYVEDDIEGDHTGTDGLVLFNMPDIFLKSANVASYVLKVGTHTISYEYNATGPVRTLSLDGGLAVTITGGGDITLGNGETTALDIERVVVYVRGSLSHLQTYSAEEKIVVTTAGDVLPKQYYRGHSVRALVRTILTQIGITNQTINTLEIETQDANPKVSLVDYPPQTSGINGYKWAMTTDGTDLFVGVGHRVYKRVMETDSYALIATMTAGDRITKLIYDGTNGLLWICYGNNLEGNGKIRRLTIAGSTLSAEVSISGALHGGICMFPSDSYCILYIDGSTRSIKRVDPSTLAVTTLFTASDLSYSAGYGPQASFAYVRGVRYGFIAIDSSSDIFLHEVVYAAGWSEEGQTSAGIPEAFVVAAWDGTDHIVYYSMVDQYVKSLAYNSTTPTNILLLSAGVTATEITFVNSTFYGTTSAYKLYSFDASAATSTLLSSAPTIKTQYHTLCEISGVLFGLDQVGRLWRYSSMLAMYVDDADFSGTNIRDALVSILNPFGLVATISPTKQAHVYRRGDEHGDPVTSGDTLVLTNAEVESITKASKSHVAFGLVEVSNDTERSTYNGTAFDTEVLSDVSRLSVSSRYIPNEIVIDLCKYLYTYFSVSRDSYLVNLANVLLYQFEPFDGATLTFTGNKITSSGTGIIMAKSIDRDGNLSFEVLK